MTFYKRNEKLMESEKWGMGYELRHDVYQEKFSEHWHNEYNIYEIYENGLCRVIGRYRNGTYARKVFEQQYC
jgi:hypothetical protein